jgi:hypothetical protein
MLLSADFSWTGVFAPLEQQTRGDHVVRGDVATAFDEELFVARLAAYVNTCSHHSESLTVKTEKEQAAQQQVRALVFFSPLLLLLTRFVPPV